MGNRRTGNTPREAGRKPGHPPNPTARHPGASELWVVSLRRHRNPWRYAVERVTEPSSHLNQPTWECHRSRRCDGQAGPKREMALQVGVWNERPTFTQHATRWIARPYGSRKTDYRNVVTTFASLHAEGWSKESLTAWAKVEGWSPKPRPWAMPGICRQGPRWMD
jgi:hypothetical protein